MNDEHLARLRRIQESLLKLRAASKSINQLKEACEKVLLDTADILVIFQISDKTAERWRKKRILKHDKISGKNIYSWASILDLIDHRFFGF